MQERETMLAQLQERVRKEEENEMQLEKDRKESDIK
jgi:hypothetical protein